jgi:hypothetical protein
LSTRLAEKKTVEKSAFLNEVLRIAHSNQKLSIPFSFLQGKIDLKGSIKTAKFKCISFCRFKNETKIKYSVLVEEAILFTMKLNGG